MKNIDAGLIYENTNNKASDNWQNLKAGRIYEFLKSLKIEIGSN